MNTESETPETCEDCGGVIGPWRSVFSGEKVLCRECSQENRPPPTPEEVQRQFDRSREHQTVIRKEQSLHDCRKQLTAMQARAEKWEKCAEGLNEAMKTSMPYRTMSAITQEALAEFRKLKEAK